MASFNDIRAEYETRLNQCWLSIAVADIAQLSLSHGWKTISRDVRAAAAVFAIAELEALLKDSLEVLHDSIERSGRSVGQMGDGIRMLHLGSVVAKASLVGGRLESSWSARMDLASSHRSKALPTLPRRNPSGYLEPIGSGTPRAPMINRIWTVYGLSRQPFPKLVWRRSLGELADIRNDVAHRRATLKQAMAGPSRTADAVAAAVIDVRDLGIHLLDVLQEYADSDGFVLHSRHVLMTASGGDQA